MKPTKYFFLIICSIFVLSIVPKSLGADKPLTYNEQRAEYWREHGYVFNPRYLTAAQMDAHVRDVERAEYWKANGYEFSSEFLTSFQMDEKVKDIEKSKALKAKGYNFDPNYLTAFQMDAVVRDTERSKYWKENGYVFDPKFMNSFQMDAKVRDFERGKFWKDKGFDFDPKFITSFEMDAFVKRSGKPEASFFDNPSQTVNIAPRPPPSITSTNVVEKPGVAENGSYYGQPNTEGVPKTVYVNGYYRKDGTYVRSHYRSSPRR
jgi:hypothetical protein